MPRIQYETHNGLWMIEPYTLSIFGHTVNVNNTEVRMSPNCVEIFFGQADIEEIGISFAWALGVDEINPQLPYRCMHTIREEVSRMITSTTSGILYNEVIRGLRKVPI